MEHSYLISYDPSKRSQESVVAGINIKPHTAYLKLFDGGYLVKTRAELTELVNALRATGAGQFMVSRVTPESLDGLSSSWDWIKKNIY